MSRGCLLALSTLVAVSTVVVARAELGRSSEGRQSPSPLQFSGPLTIICNVRYVQGWVPQICSIDQPLTDDRTPKKDPDWSSDGTRVAFERAGTIYIRTSWLRPSADEPFHGTERRLVEGREPAWSPSGNHLAYVRGPTGSRDVYLVEDSGARVRPLTRSGSDNYAPAWSPDGMTIAYTSGSTIRLIRSDGSADRALGPGREPAWSVNRRRLAFEHQGDIWVQNVDGSGRKNVTATPDLQETSPVWSPDGQARMAYVGRSPSGELGLYTLMLGRAPVRRFAEPLEERPLVEPVVDWQPVRVLVPTVSIRRPIVSVRDAKGNILRTIRPGCYSAGYVDQSKRHGIIVAGVGFAFIGLNLLGPGGGNTVRFVGRRWPSAGQVSNCGWLETGLYRYWDPAHPRLRGTFRVVDRP
jgi:hypothetical protein